LDRQFADRAKRAADSARKELWTALGVNSQDEFDALVKAKKDAEDAQKSEMDKMTEQVTKATDRTAQLQIQIETANKRLVDGEIKLLATQPVEKDGKVTRAAFRPDALDIIIALIDRNGIQADDGKVTGIVEALDALAKEKLFLLVGDGKPAAPAPKGTPGGTEAEQPNSNNPGDTNGRRRNNPVKELNDG
jgi:hypothetical protein